MQLQITAAMRLGGATLPVAAYRTHYKLKWLLQFLVWPSIAGRG
jgi:hypothetical protein